METVFPGTVIERRGKNAREFLDSVFFATDGIMLSQVRKITALETPALQNWVNRGLVERPDEKMYSKNQLARIILINMLRSVTKNENIGKIMTYINGSATSRDDDIIGEADLYIYICEILDKITFETLLSPDELNILTENTIKDYIEPFGGAHKRLCNGIKMILLYYAASLIKGRADIIMEGIVND
ncbi:MAG: hypothetical protein DBX47_04180 [Clostridiales bacterium]|nr:MAG: hypothetical protein DBX47_04180 [Clostridiales bacterium]